MFSYTHINRRHTSLRHINGDINMRSGICTDKLHRQCRQQHTGWGGSQQDRCTSTPLAARAAVSHVLPQTAQEENRSAQTGVTVIISFMVCVCLCVRLQCSSLDIHPFWCYCNYTHISPNPILSALRVWQLNTQTPLSSHYCLHDFHIWADTHSLYPFISQRWSISLAHSHFFVQAALNT